MSGIAGIYHFDGRPADRARLRRMAEAMAHRGPDGLNCWMQGPVGLAHAMLHATPESLRETQPLQDDAGALRLTLDGRIDNRDELRAALQGRGFAPRNDGDAELVLRAYQCWGEDCAQHILGDFAFALWNETTRTLFCARDALGTRPFYYCCGSGSFVFASELQQLFEGAAIERAPNDGMIGEYLANAITSRDETLYRGILRLPPAHCLRVQPGGVRLRRYWDADPGRAMRYRTDAQYAEHFMEIFTAALRCRLRSPGGIAAELSGGLDSSSIVCMAQSLRRNGAPAGADLETFSLAFPGMPCDESAYIADVVRSSGARNTVLPPHQPPASCHADYVSRHGDFPGYPGNYMWDSIRQRLRERGHRVLLTGLGGDDWFAGGDVYYVELLRRLKFRELLQRARSDCAESGVAGAAAEAYLELRHDLLPLLPPVLLQAIRTALGREGVPAWIRPQFARRSRLRERLQKKPDRHRFESRSQRDLYRWLNSGYLVHSFECDDRSAAGAGFEMRHPFHDRRLVEFALALPPEQLWRDGQSKFVLRQAMQGLLPESVRQRSTKADFSHAVANALQAQGGEALFDTLAIDAAGWVDKGRLRALYRRMNELYARGAQEYADHIWPPWMAFGIELWYKTRFHPGSGAAAPGFRG